MDKPLRLQVYLARCNIGSRRKCEEIISQGRVRVNGRVVKTQGEKVEDDDTGKDVEPEGQGQMVQEAPAF